jgi:hypothetical protein
MPAETFAAYFSHSWKSRDVNLNVEIWTQISDACELVVDLPATLTKDPPYYINRIEELLRGSDVFVSVLAARGAAPDPAAAPGTDATLRCSSFALFEVRLAERFSLPRLVIYERSTGFRPPAQIKDNEMYLAFDRAEKVDLPERRQLQQVMRPKIRAWLDWVIGHHRPKAYQPETSALIVLPEDSGDAAEAKAVLAHTLRQVGYDPIVLEASATGNADAFRLLERAGLVVMDVGPTSDWAALQVAAGAHARGIPAIRVLRRTTTGPLSNTDLPWMLRDHPGGYQKDIVMWNTPEQLASQLVPRASAMFNVVRALNAEAASRHFQSKRYEAYSVFVSHNLKAPHRDLVEEIFGQLEQRQVKCFEYQEVNRPGIDWNKELKTQLAATTHFVALFGDGYETSEACTSELETVLARGDAVRILPYLLEGRTVPHVKLRGRHHPLLHDPDPRANARVVVEHVMELLVKSLAEQDTP